MNKKFLILIFIIIALSINVNSAISLLEGFEDGCNPDGTNGACSDSNHNAIFGWTRVSDNPASLRGAPCNATSAIHPEIGTCPSQYITEGSHAYKIKVPVKINDIIKADGNTDVSNAIFISAGDTIYYDIACVTQSTAGTLFTFKLMTGSATTEKEHICNSSSATDFNLNESYTATADGNMRFEVEIVNEFDFGSEAYMVVDNLRTAQPPNLLLTNLSPSTAEANQDVNLVFQVTNDVNGEKVSDATVKVDFDSLGFVDANFNSTDGLYYFLINEVASTYSYDVNATSPNYGDASLLSGETIDLTLSLPSALDANDITNVTSTVNDFNLSLVPIDESKTIEYCLDNNSISTLNVKHVLINTKKVFDKYYSIFTATQSEFNLGIWNYNDTLSVGSGQTSGIQTKFRNNRFEYSFTHALLGNTTKCYKAVRIDVDGTENLDNEAWSLTANRSGIDFNGIVFDSLTLNSFTNFEAFKKSLLQDENATEPTNYAFIWNAFRDGNYNNANTRIFEKDEGATTTLKDAYSISSVNESSYLTSFSKTMSGDSHLFMDSNNSNISVLNFALPKLLKRGFFDDEIQVTKPDNSSLDLLIDNNKFFKYAREGDPFRVKTHINAWDNELTKVNLLIYLDSRDVPGNNLVYTDTLDFNNQFGFFDIDFLVPEGILDLNANSPNREVHVVVQAVNIKNKIYEIQEQAFTLLQFPHFPNDLRLFLTEESREVGEHPQGTIKIDIDTSDKLDGVQLIVNDDNVLNSDLDFNIFFWKNEDFECSVFECEFNYLIEDYVFAKKGVYTYKLVALVSTEAYNAENSKLYNQFSIYVGTKEIELAHLFQVFERSDFKYKNTELIPVVVSLRSTTKENLRDKVDIKLQLTDCDANSTGACDVAIDTNYSHDGFLYDARTGENFWFYRKIFTGSSSSLLTNGDYYRVFAHVTSSTGEYDFIEKPVLSSKCKAKAYHPNFFNPATIIFDVLTGNIFSSCNTNQENIVTLTTNSSEEQRILIDNSLSLNNPNQEGMVCWSDSNANLVRDRLLCSIVYSTDDIAIDKIDVTISNRFSDLAEKEYKNRQDLEFTIPFETVVFNDMQLLKRALEVKYKTPINTIGDALMYGFNDLASKYGSGIAEQNFKLGHIFTNLQDFNNFTIYNYDVDFDFTDVFNPDNLTGVVFFEVNDIKLINALQERKVHPELKNASSSKLLKTAEALDINIASNQSNLKVYVADMAKIIDKDVENNLVEEFGDPVTKDVNGISQLVPNVFTLNVVSDLVFSSIKADRLFITINFASFQKAGFNAVLAITESLTELADDPFAWAVKHWFLFFILLVVMLFIAYIYALIGKGRQGF